ncbi:very-short-patch-repair endonuclease [Pararhizobium capsulatum DSM 1112]|uniref:Very-short-patch-repair endonuclease n=1 Tax=Pararhizobium capsulatum DSM 1112 TaxID=1121113 RepID=A0ABU0BPD3_9HYPH|nr:endonuclease domain-containing protein [Pararhizobium capsulatum]MDQ0320110.1 very-short-patch-repair endonuclease [Pararhizobium capsulatum DSM 1112]
MAWNRENPQPASREAARNAPRLRRSLTDAERRFWTALRKELAEMPDTHFRRQVPIGRYVADFVCLGRRLIIGLDGEIHADPEQRKRDVERDAYLRAQDFRVIRFKNRDVMLDMKTVLKTIAVELGRCTPTPSPSPQGRGVPGGSA